MKTEHHISITKEAIAEKFSASALEVILKANIGQDALRYQFGHDHYHYDNNQFARSDAYVKRLRYKSVKRAIEGDLTGAWVAFGKLSHTVQDFYAHSNYIELTRAASENFMDIPIRDTDGALPPGIISGKVYYPFEAITFITKIPQVVNSWFPADSHARLNKDAPGRKHYEEAFRLAVGATVAELGKISQQLTEEQRHAFFDRGE